MINFLKDLIYRSGDICRQRQSSLNLSDVDFKNRKDLVTSTDKEVETFITKQIMARFPGHRIWGEEFGLNTGNSDAGDDDTADNDYLWIIDPIDGTTSYFHHQPFYSISIAVQHRKNALFSAVYAPMLDELFYAGDGQAFLNDTPIRVSSTDQMIHAVMATGFACLRAELTSNNLPYFNRIVPRLRDIRRYGSAALDLCYVACGRLDGFWEMNLNRYDIAAGAHIVQCAGGFVKDMQGKTDFPEKGTVAANAALMEQLLPFFK